MAAVPSAFVALTVMTWNLKGSERPDTAVVVDRARAAGADVLFLQEVQRRQAESIARGLDAVSLAWGFKHWPVIRPAEGMAVIGVSHRADVRCHPLTSGWMLWSWRRRIMQSGLVAVPTGSPGRNSGSGDARGGTAGSGDAPAGAVRVVNLHLSPGRDASLREREVARVLDILATSGDDGDGGELPLVLAGDLNDSPAAALFDHLDAAGLRDAWEVAHPGLPEREGATNWSGGREGAPRRRIDYVLVSRGVGVVAASVPRPGDDGFEALRSLSDHLPVTVVLQP